MKSGLMAALLLAVAAIFVSMAAQAAPPPERQQALRHLARQDCGACHGLTFKGGLGLPLTAEALRGKPDDSLVAAIMNGRPGTAMPPWRPFLTEEEAQWMVQWLKEGAPPSR